MTYETGDTVTHRFYGKGTIQKCERAENGKLSCIVDFQIHGVKRVYASTLKQVELATPQTTARRQRA